MPGMVDPTPRRALWAAAPLLAGCAGMTSAAPSTGEHALFAHLRALSRRAPVVVAHRGDSGRAPENTLVAFHDGVAAGAAVVEFDYRETRDGVPVCIHDATLDRTTDAVARLGGRDLAIAEHDWAALRDLDAGAWKGTGFAGTPLPTLEAGLREIAAGGIPMIEHKAGDPARLVQLLARLDLTERAIVQSFDWDFVAAVHRLEPRIATAVLGDGAMTDERLRGLPATGAGMVHWQVRDLRAEDVLALHRRGLLVCVYTANDDASLIGCAAMGIDAITTNHPGRLAHLVRIGRAARAD